jgi:hypothetical protein
MPCTNGLDVPARHSAKGKGCAVQPLFAKVTPLRSPDCPTEADEDSVRGTHGSGPRQGARHSFHSLFWLARGRTRVPILRTVVSDFAAMYTYSISRNTHSDPGK